MKRLLASGYERPRRPSVPEHHVVSRMMLLGSSPT
jgi:hypothetical protein